jgi:hypothetical protein
MCVRMPLAAYLSGLDPEGKNFGVEQAAGVLEDGFKRYDRKLALEHGVHKYSINWAASRRVLNCT